MKSRSATSICSVLAASHGFAVRFSLDDIDEFLLRVNPHFLVDMIRVGLDGPLCDEKLIGDVFGIAPLCQEDEYLSFAWSEVESFRRMRALVFIRSYDGALLIRLFMFIWGSAFGSSTAIAVSCISSGSSSCRASWRAEWSCGLRAVAEM